MARQDLQHKYETLFNKICALRNTQIAYFTAGRSRQDLDKAKRLERELDNYLRAEIKERKTGQQLLF